MYSRHTDLTICSSCRGMPFQMRIYITVFVCFVFAFKVKAQTGGDGLYTGIFFNGTRTKLTHLNSNSQPQNESDLVSI